LNEFVLERLKKNPSALLSSSDYIFDKNGDKIIDHVLHFETLNTDGEFDALMKKFDLNIKLPEYSLNRRKSGDGLTLDDFSKESIYYINEYYENDFISFGYSFKEITQKKNELEFIHIVKNAGTPIENAAAKEGIAWGSCHYKQFGHCLHVIPDFSWNGRTLWHNFPKRLEINPYAEDTVLFTVVRNPYDRFISYYYFCNRSKDMEFLNNKENLNEFAKVQKKDTLYTQHHYVYYDDGTQMIDHVLHLETLHSDGKFEELMKKYDLNIKLPDIYLKQRESGNKLTIKDLSKETFDYINKRYEKDFILFGYDFVKEN